MKISGSITQGFRGIGFFNKFSSRIPEGSLVGGFFLGISLGVLWIPCVGPIIGAVLAIVASVGNMSYGAWMLIVIGIMLLFGVDKLIIKWLSPYFPTTF